MTVKELIKQLNMYNQNAEVIISENHFEHDTEIDLVVEDIKNNKVLILTWLP